MKKVTISDKTLRKAAGEGIDSFVGAFVDAINKTIDGNLNAENMAELNAQQVTLLAWNILHEEVMDGGFVQLIYNGYGPFIFKNPFAKAIKQWGLTDAGKMVYAAHTLYNKYKDTIEQELTDEQFMALYEQCPEFDDLDDMFIENEEEWTTMVAHYLDDNIEQFADIE